MFIAALFTNMEATQMSIYKQTDKEAVVHIFNGILLSQKKKPSAATWMKLEITILSEVRKRQISYKTSYMWNLKYGMSESIHKQTYRETDS